MVRKIEIERFSIITSKAFGEVVKTLNDAIAHPHMADFWRIVQQTETVAELEGAIQKALGRAGLMLFAEFDHGSIVRKGTGRDTPRILRLVIGNALIMKEMARHVPDAGSYAPLTVLVDERDDGVHLSYDRMASLLAPYGHAAALDVARNLDHKIEELLQKAAV
jgi:uncharacterized protein (DUF302 family)